jgi:hypothetical protein
MRSFAARESQQNSAAFVSFRTTVMQSRQKLAVWSGNKRFLCKAAKPPPTIDKR